MKKAKLEEKKDLQHKKLYKSFQSEIKTETSDGRRVVVAQITTPSTDRSKDHVNPKGIDTTNFMKNPVVLFAHKYDELPVAKCTGLKASDSGILATVEFPEEGRYEKSDLIYWMCQNNYLSATSIGFMPNDYEVNKDGGCDFNTSELFEFSFVPVPDQPEALLVMRSKGIDVDKAFEDMRGKELPEDFVIEKEVIEKGVIAYKETPKAPEDEKWDAGEEVKAATVDDLKVMCAWFDSDNADNKSAYKLPHHKAEGDHAVVWNGVKAAGAAVQGARSKLAVPDEDLDGIKAHLAKHYEEFDQTPPWEDDKDDGKAITDETVETKKVSKKEANDLSTDAPISGLSIGQLKDLLADGIKGVLGDKSVEMQAKSVVTKGVDEVIMLSDVLSCLSWVIWAFENDPDGDVNQASVDKLNQALGIILSVVQGESVMSEKSFKLADLPQGKEYIKIIAKAGRTISSKHEEMLSDAQDHMKQASDTIQTVLNTATPTETNDGVDDAGKSVADDELFLVIAEPLTKAVKETADEDSNDDEDDIYGMYPLRGGEKN